MGKRIGGQILRVYINASEVDQLEKASHDFKMQGLEKSIEELAECAISEYLLNLRNSR